MQRTKKTSKYQTFKHISTDRRTTFINNNKFKEDNEKLTKKIKLILDTIK